jgi:hypothetical protein
MCKKKQKKKWVSNINAVRTRIDFNHGLKNQHLTTAVRGEGVWFWKVFGGGGFGGWRRKRKRNMLLLGFLLIFGLGLLFGKEVERNVLCG